MKATLPMRILNLALLALVCVPLVAMASDDERKHRGKHKGGEYKEKFRDGDCKVEREWKNGKYKEERECEGRGERRPYPSRAVIVQPAPVIMVPVPAVAYPPWVIYEQGQPVYRMGQEPRPVVQRGAVHCNSERVGQVIGGIAGAAIGNQVGRGSGRALATVGGAVAGVLIGGNVGRQIDVNNQACIAKALEFAPVGQRIEWSNATEPQYAVIPGRVQRRGGQYCRRYDAEVFTQDGWQPTRGMACRRSDGVWVASQ